MIFIFLILIVIAVTILFAPFPDLRTYALLWRYVLTERQPEIGFRARLRQGFFLLRSGALMPLWTLLWFIDELLFPQYREQTVRPVFIIGEPRCGTTLLHRTLAADQRNFFAIRHFEWRYPFICVQKLVHWLELEPLLEKISYWPNTETGRVAMRMHSNMLYDYEEDGIFYEERFLHHLFVFLRFPYPGLLPALDSFPELADARQRRMLAIHQKVVQKMAFLAPCDDAIYLSKEVTSHTKIPRLIEMYPLARFVLLVRPSGELIDSLLALVRISTMAKTDIDPIRIEGWKEAFLARMRRDCETLVELSEEVIESEKQACLSFQSLTQQMADVVQWLYIFLGLPLDNSFVTYLQTQENQQSERERGYEYEHEQAPGFEIYDNFVRQVEGRSFQSDRRLPSAS
jgi:hypothetical protein